MASLPKPLKRQIVYDLADKLQLQHLSLGDKDAEIKHMWVGKINAILENSTTRKLTSASLITNSLTPIPNHPEIATVIRIK